jgi:unsaturated rhamnogalacturonyl hydrolase
MVFGLLPMNAFAATADETLAEALTEARTYIDNITVSSVANDPEKVVKNFKTHFTWDNEKRENGKSYLYDWSYYNGVVFEGIEYLYEVTGKEEYKNYVIEYMSSMIDAGGTWAKCSNDSTKECAGYSSTHGADCYKTASLLLDAYEMTNDSRYLTIAKALYADLDTAAANSSYNLSKCGNNYRHTWASDPSPDLWLDGLYMILPFRAEYAKHIGDQDELDLVVSRMQWVSNNMYNSANKLFYHAADSATSNSGNHWLRAIGWYAAAIVDIMDSMEGKNL